LHKLPKTTNLIIALVIIISSGILIYKLFSSRKTDSQAESTTSISKPIITTVTALGRLEPRGQVIKVSARSGVSSNKIEQILVKEGEEVTENQVLAILDNHQLLTAALKQAEEQLRVVIGFIVGIVIVYQVLSADVNAHLSEYATFQAMGYRYRSNNCTTKKLISQHLKIQ